MNVITIFRINSLIFSVMAGQTRVRSKYDFIVRCEITKYTYFTDTYFILKSSFFAISHL